MALNIPRRTLQVPTNQPQTLILDATPFLGKSDELWDEGLKLIHHWMVANFTYGKVYGDFEFAQALGVHRIIGDEWLAGLAAQKRIKSYSAYIGDPRMGGNNEAPAFMMMTPLEPPGKVKLDISKVCKYDPWVDRQFDDDVDAARFPDLYIDKYFEVMLNEYYVLKRNQRVRPNGHYVNPLDFAEHPRYADPKAKKDRPFDIKWREVISERVNGSRSRKS